MIYNYNSFEPCHTKLQVSGMDTATCQDVYDVAVLKLWESLREAATIESKEYSKKKLIDDNIAKIIESGGAEHFRISDLLCDLGFGLAACSWKHFCFLLGFTPSVMHVKPTASSRRVPAFQGLDLVSFTYLLLRMRRWGFDIDPKPFIQAVLPTLTKTIITDKELDIIWWEKENKKIDPYVSFLAKIPEKDYGMVYMPTTNYTVVAGFRSLTIASPYCTKKELTYLKEHIE